MGGEQMASYVDGFKLANTGDGVGDLTVLSTPLERRRIAAESIVKYHSDPKHTGGHNGR